MLSPEENDNAWHGGCLALAELGTFNNSSNIKIIYLLFYIYRSSWFASQ